MTAYDSRSRRRFIKATGATAVAGLAGCSGDGGSDGGDGSSDGGGSNGGDGGDGTTTGDTNGESDTSIQFWHIFGGELGDQMTELANEFSDRDNGITVEASSKGGYRENLNATLQAARSGNPPAVSQIFEIGTRLCLDSGAFTPVEDILPQDKINSDDFLDPVLDYYRIDGKLNSMPFNSSNTIMVYNKDAFEEAGLDPEDPPRSLSGVTDAAQQIVDAGATEKGITWPNHSWMQIEQQFAKQDQELVNKENGRAGRPDETNYNSEAGRNVYNWWKEIADKDLYLNPGIEAWGEARQAFLTGKTAMLWDSTSNIVSITAGGQENGFEPGTAYLPAPNGDNNGVVIGGGSLWVPDALSDEKKDAAGEFLAFLTETEQQKAWHKGTGYFPVRQSAIDELESEGFYEENPNFVTAIEQLRDSKGTPATRGAVMGVFTKARSINSEISVEIFEGETSVEDGLDKMDEQVQAELEKYDPSQFQE